MKPLRSLLPVTLLFASSALHADTVLKPQDVVAICGDSITEQKRYSVFMEDYLLMCQPVENLRAAQLGWSGEKAPGFLARIDSDVLPFKPTVATTCYGMNDGGYTRMTSDIGETYRKAMTASVEKLKAGGVRAIVVGSPGAVDSAAFINPGVSAEDYNKTLAALGDIAQDVARKEGVGYADVHTPMIDVMAKARAAYGADYQLVAGGGVHPNNNGHLVMAYAFLKGLGCDGSIGTITVDLANGRAEGTPGQKILASRDGTVEVESTRYPFCFQGDADKPEQTDACIVKFLPFNQDLNRYLLVVKGLKGSKAKVTWGDQTKEFSATDLENGVNLAAEFLINPFCRQFDKVNAAVQVQQAQDTVLVKDFLHNLPAFKTMAPHSGPELDKIAKDGMAREKELFDKAVSLVIPVRHTIKIEPESQVGYGDTARPRLPRSPDAGGSFRLALHADTLK